MKLMLARLREGRKADLLVCLITAFFVSIWEATRRCSADVGGSGVAQLERLFRKIFDFDFVISASYAGDVGIRSTLKLRSGVSPANICVIPCLQGMRCPSRRTVSIG